MRHFCFIFLFLFPLACFSQDTIKINLYLKDTLKTIPSDFAGLSFEKNSLNQGVFSPRHGTLIRLFQTCGIKSLRIGGNSVDRTAFSNGTTTDSLFTTNDLDSLFLFAQTAGCKILLGLNLRDSNASLAATEASYVMELYNNELFGFEVGNEPDMYAKHFYRGKNYWDTNYEKEYMKYYDTIKLSQPKAVFTGPACASSYTEFTMPFCRKMDAIIPLPLSMLTQHYYGGDTTATVPELIDTLMNKEKLRSLSAEVKRLVHCADSSGIPFRMSECNSLSHGGKKGVSNAFVSALWALDYLYKLAYDSCAGVNFHGGLDGAYPVFSREDTTYSARPIAYGILAFQIGSKGRFISSKVTNDTVNLDSYSVIDCSKNIYTTIINKEKGTLPIELIILKAGNSKYLSAEYLQLSSDSLGDTKNVSLGGQKVKSNGTIPDYKWNPLKVDSNTTKIPVPGGSAVVVKFTTKTGSSVINDYSEKNKHLLNPYPNPASEKVTIITDMSENPIIFIYNLQGQLLLQQQVQQGKTDIDISDLAKGVYILRLYSNARVEVGRIMKE